MATWVTHMMVADSVMKKFSCLDRHGFCVGNIAPDCNIENDDWTDFTPSRSVTHWMSGERKKITDSDRFYKEYIENRICDIKTNEEYSFLMGYYSHLITDAKFQRFIRDESRVAAVWERINKHPVLLEKSTGMPKDWDSVKKLIEKDDRTKDIYSLEADYLEQHPESGYYTEILELKDFPDYIDYLPTGAITRKIKVMGYIPTRKTSAYPYIAMSKEEYYYFVERGIHLVIKAFKSKLTLQKHT